MRRLPNVLVDPTASISEDARIRGSSRGTKIEIGARCKVYEFVVIQSVGGSGDVSIGSDCYINPHVMIYSGNGVRIGNNVLIAAGAVIAPTNHNFSDPSVPIRLQGFMDSRGGVVVEDDCWIGSNCTLLDGAWVGKGSIVAAGSVVNRKLEQFGIYAGLPAKKIGIRG